MEALAGNVDAVSKLARWAVGPLFRFCYYRLGQDEHLCEDVVQETLLRSIDRLGGYDPSRSDGDIFPWLTGLARNEIRRALSRSSSPADLGAIWARMDRELLGLYGMLEQTPMDDELLQRSETRDMVNATMSQLPVRYGRALEAKYVLGRSVREISTALGHSEKAVESLLARARQAFRTTFLALSRSLESSCPRPCAAELNNETGMSHE